VVLLVLVHLYLLLHPSPPLLLVDLLGLADPLDQELKDLLES